MSKFLVIALIIVFNFMISGCATSKQNYNTVWEFPPKPIKREVNSVTVKKGIPFTPESDGIYLDIKSLENLLFNIDELDIYIEKQKFLIETIRKYK